MGSSGVRNSLACLKCWEVSIDLNFTMIMRRMFRDRYPLRISLCDSTRPIHSSPRRLVVRGLSSVTKQQIDQVEEIFRLHPNFARARCAQLLGHMVRSILEHADENNSMKILSQKHQPAIICINGNWPLSTRPLSLEPVTLIESRGETRKGN